MCPCKSNFFKMMNSLENPIVYINSALYKRGVDTDLNEGLYEHLLFAEFADPLSFKDAFAKAGVALAMDNREQMISTAKLLADFSVTADDVNGKLVNPEKKQVFFNVKDILKNVDISNEEVKNSPLKFTTDQTSIS